MENEFKSPDWNILHGYTHIEARVMFSSLGKRQISDEITTWFHKKNMNYLSPSNVVNVVCKKFLSLCKFKNLNLAVSKEQLHESLSEATCVMYHAKRANKGWDGPHRKFPYPSDWTTDYERYWDEFLNNYLFTDEYWDLFWRSIHVESCEIDIVEWKQNMQLILPQYILRESVVLKSNGLILDSKIMYTDEKTNEPVYEEDMEEEYY